MVADTVAAQHILTLRTAAEPVGAGGRVMRCLLRSSVIKMTISLVHGVAPLTSGMRRRRGGTGKRPRRGRRFAAGQRAGRDRHLPGSKAPARSRQQHKAVLLGIVDDHGLSGTQGASSALRVIGAPAPSSPRSCGRCQAQVAARAGPYQHQASLSPAPPGGRLPAAAGGSASPSWTMADPSADPCCSRGTQGICRCHKVAICTFG